MADDKLAEETQAEETKPSLAAEAKEAGATFAELLDGLAIGEEERAFTVMLPGKGNAPDAPITFRRPSDASDIADQAERQGRVFRHQDSGDLEGRMGWVVPRRRDVLVVALQMAFYSMEPKISEREAAQFAATGGVRFTVFANRFLTALSQSDAGALEAAKNASSDDLT